MIKIAIVGYGNLGKATESLLINNKDVKIVGVFTRRDPNNVNTLGTTVYDYQSLFDLKGKIDVCILCGGSANDLPIQTPELARYFNVVDSFDTHSHIMHHKAIIQEETENTTAIISAGWDPGLFSIQRLLLQAIFKDESATFWGEGVSQGHSDVLRRLPGVIDAIQVTVPKEEVLTQARQGNFENKDRHKRVCYVVTERTDYEQLTHEIKNIPDYFKGYETEVNYVSQEALNLQFPTMPHGGHVIASDGMSLMEFQLKAKSNPHFTAQVLIAYAIAAFRMNQEHQYGCFTVYDIPLRYLLNDCDSLI